MTPVDGSERRPAGRHWPRRRTPFALAGLEVRAGRSGAGEVPIPRLVTGTPVSLPLRVVHGRHDGPTVLVSSTIHGDEIAGVEIIRRVTEALVPSALHGTVILVPIVNVHGFLTGDRYLPDRRDLNRSFPGSAKGSLASRIAHVFMDELVSRSDVGIDLHTGSDHRTNLPQVRGDLDDPTTRDLAVAFGAPVMLHARVRDGSLRAAGTAAGVTMLLYEGGEPHRFDERAIRAGADGTLRVLHRLGMTPDDEPPPLPLDDGSPRVPVASRRSSWIRARRSGIAVLDVTLGDRVTRGARLAVIHDALGNRLSSPRAPADGVVIGHTQHPLVHQGDALVHLARVATDTPTAPDREASDLDADHTAGPAIDPEADRATGASTDADAPRATPDGTERVGAPGPPPPDVGPTTHHDGPPPATGSDATPATRQDPATPSNPTPDRPTDSP